MKKIIILICTMLFVCGLVGCGSSPSTAQTEDKVVLVEQTTNEPTEEELNQKLKKDAVTADFVKINGHEAENKGLKVKVTGKVSVVDNTKKIELFDCFSLTTKDGDGYGMYTIINMLSFPVTEGETVTVYGTVNEEKSNYGGPGITATVIEK